MTMKTNHDNKMTWNWRYNKRHQFEEDSKSEEEMAEHSKDDDFTKKLAKALEWSRVMEDTDEGL